MHSKATASQIPVLETSLRRWRFHTSDDDTVEKRRVDREVARLLQLLSTLREDLCKPQDDAGKLGCVSAISPFVDVVKSPAISSNVKACAIECLERIISAISPSDSEAVEAVTQVCEAILECRFESPAPVEEELLQMAFGNSADEVAKIWLLEGLGACTRFTNQGVGLLLPEDILFRVTETLFDASTAPFNSETVKSVAMRILSKFIRELFSVAAIFFGTQDPQLALTARRTFLFLVEMADPEHVTSALHHVMPQNTSTVSWTRFVALRLLVEACLASASNDTVVAVVRDSTIVEIIKDELMRTLVQTAQRAGTTSTNNSDPYRLFVISETLRLANVFLGNAECRALLRIQSETFVNAVYCRVLEKAVSPKFRNDEAVLVIESLCDLLANNGSTNNNVLVDLFVSYDLSLQSTDLFENSFKLLSRLAHPMQLSVPALDPFRLLSLRGLLASLRSLSIDDVDAGAAAQEEERIAEELKQRKFALNRCAEAFNSKPSRGIAALVSEGVLSPLPDMDPLVLASFLRNTPSLDKIAVGQFLGEEAEFNRQVLRCYTETFDVRNRTLVDSLRSFLECFRLPKEAQQIDRIIQAFADVAYSQCLDAEHFPTVDSCYLLCFAIIMLNTDLHNPNIRPERRMTLHQFSTNNRNYGEEISKGKPFPDAFLKRIFDAIAKREINTLKDGSSLTAECSTDKWSDLLSRSRAASAQGVTTTTTSTAGYKKTMFKLIWKHALVAVKVVFASGQTTEQPEALHQALDGFLLLAKCSAAFHLHDAFDCVMADLCKFTSLLVYNKQQLVGFEEEGGRTLAMDFGNNHKGQMAAMSVFALTRKFGCTMRKAWRHVLWCVLRLADLGLVSVNTVTTSSNTEGENLLDVTAFADFHAEMRKHILEQHDGKMQAKRKLAVAIVGEEAQDVNASSVSTWTSWLWGGMSAEDEEEEYRNNQAWLEMDEDHRACMSGMRVADALMHPSFNEPVGAAKEEEVEMQYAMECVKSCRPLGILKDTRQLSNEALGALIDALLQALDVLPASANNSAPAGAATAAMNVDDLDIDLLSPPNTGSKIFALHLLTEIVLINHKDKFDFVFTQRVAPALQTMLDQDKLAPPTFLTEQVCIALLRMSYAGVFAQPLSAVACMVALGTNCVPTFPGLDSLLGKMVLDLVSMPEFWVPVSALDMAPICGWETLLTVISTTKTSPQALDAAQVALLFAKDKRDVVSFACAHLWDEASAMRVVDFCASFESDTVETLRELVALCKRTPQPCESQRLALHHLLQGFSQTTAAAAADLAVFNSLILSTCEYVLENVEDVKTRVAACDLLVKAFLHVASLTTGQHNTEFASTWVRVLETLERYKQQGGGEVVETCSELAKNLLLAMSSQGLLPRDKAWFVVTGQALEEQVSSSSLKDSFWEVTWAVLDRSPALMKDLHEAPGNAIDLRESGEPVVETPANKEEEEQQLQT